jgi:4-amino-4-deoxy-L-arabinose transferase-like glycosyltransferase
MVSRVEPAGHGAGDPPASGRRSTILIVVALTVLAAVLRFYRIGNQNLWLDEVTLLNAVNMGESVTPKQFFGNIQGPFHAGIVWFVTQVTMREGALRSVSAVASVATVPVIFLLGRALFDRAAGLWAAFLLAVSPFSVWYAQEVKNYAMLHAFAAVSTLLVFRMVEHGARRWVGYVFSMIVGLYLNLSMAFLAVGHNAFGATKVLRDDRFRRAWVIAYVIIVVAFIPSLWGVARWADVSEVPDRVVFVPVAEEETLLRGEHTFTATALPYSVFAMGYGFTLGPGLTALHLEPTAAPFLRHARVVVPAAVALAAALVLGLVRAARNRAVLGLVVSIAIAVFAGAALSALLNIKPFTVRYVSVVFPLLIVVAAAGVGWLPRWPRAVLAGVIVLASGISLWHHYYDPGHWKEDVRSAARYIEEHELAGDVVVAPVVAEVFDYYFRGDAEWFTVYASQTGSDERVRTVVDEGAGGARRLWLIDARLWGVDPDRRIPAYLGGRHALLDRQVFPNAVLSLYGVSREEGGGERVSAIPRGTHAFRTGGGQTPGARARIAPGRAADRRLRGRPMRRPIAATVARVMLYTDEPAPTDAGDGEVRWGVAEWRRTH